jgi:hypothetical protein
VPKRTAAAFMIYSILKNSGVEDKANVVCHLHQVYFAVTEQSWIEGAINVYVHSEGFRIRMMGSV